MCDLIGLHTVHPFSVECHIAVRHGNSGKRCRKVLVGIPACKRISISLWIIPRKVFPVLHIVVSLRLHSIVRRILIRQGMRINLIAIQNIRMIRIYLETVDPAALIERIPLDLFRLWCRHYAVRLTCKGLTKGTYYTLARHQFIVYIILNLFRHPFRVSCQVMCRHSVISELLGQGFILIPVLHTISQFSGFFFTRLCDRCTVLYRHRIRFPAFIKEPCHRVFSSVIFIFDNQISGSVLCCSYRRFHCCRCFESLIVLHCRCHFAVHRSREVLLLHKGIGLLFACRISILI